MLDKINNYNTEALEQNQNLEKIRGIGVSNPFLEDENNFFIDESHISSEALKKYQREIDVKNFSEILKNTDQKSADTLVLQQAFEGMLSVDDENTLFELLNCKDFLNDIF